MLTIAYIRVSTEEQTDHSPEAQRKRCLSHALSQNLGPVTFLNDEGVSGKTLDRPAMNELIALVEANEVQSLVVWRLDRLSRDGGDLHRLIRLFDKHCVTVHSVNEGQVQVGTAAGRMQAGMHGVFAQYYREHVVENVRLGITEAINKGRWLNRAPTGYDMINGELKPNEMAPLISRVFELRGLGKSYPEIEQATGIKYSTARQICGNRVYLGLTRIRDDWFPGIHQPLVSQTAFDAAQRGNSTGRRIGKDLLSGRVVCGRCERRIAVEYNDKGTAIYRCKHRGKGCDIPGRSAPGLQRAARLAMRVLADDKELQNAIRHELSRQGTGAQSAQPTRSGTVAKLRQKRQKLLDLYFADNISPSMFAEAEGPLTKQIDALEREAAEATASRERRTVLADHFEQVATLLRDLDLDTIWEAANDDEKRTLVTELVEAIIVYPDRLQVTINGALPLTVDFEEVGLRPAGMRTMVSKGGLEPPRDFSH